MIVFDNMLNRVKKGCKASQLADENEQRRQRRDLKKAKRKYIRSKHIYDTAEKEYQKCVVKGDRELGQFFKDEMKKALDDLKNSGYTE